MPERKDIVGASHDFHSEAYARWWAERFKITPVRRECFDHVAGLLEASGLIGVSGDSPILELGVGPGYLAEFLLNRFPRVGYLGIDYSGAMLQIAEERLAVFSRRVAFRQLDLTASGWEADLAGQFAAIVSTWSLHDLGSKERVFSVYRTARTLLRERGVIINADFIKPTVTERNFEPGRFPISEHLQLLSEAGFVEVECTKEFEINLTGPASHNNYACMTGRAMS